MKKALSIFGSLALLVTTAATAETRQEAFVTWHDNPAADFSAFPAPGYQRAVRMAFPMKNRALALDLGASVRPTRVVLPLIKLTAGDPVNDSGAGAMQVWAGDDPAALSRVEEAVIQIEKGETEGAATETVTVTGLPKARYWQFYVPREQPGYVFGFASAFRDVKVFSDHAAEVAKLPLLSSLDPDWAKGALPVQGFGYRDHVNDADVATEPFAAEGGTAQLGWPWKHRSVGFSLSEPATLGKIVITLVKMQESRPEMETGLENARVFSSEDNQHFTETKPQVSTLLYRDDGGKIYAQITLSGPFSGRYFRIFVPWEKNYYVYGTPRLDRAIKVFPAARLSVKKFHAPLSAGAGIPVFFVFPLDPAGVEGVATIRVDGVDEPLWSAPFSQLKRENQLELNPRDLPSGVITLRLELSEAGVAHPSVARRSLRFNPADVAVRPRDAAGFTALSSAVGPQLLAADAAGARLEYPVPAAGSYALYLELKGAGRFRVEAPGIDRTAALSRWHPADPVEGVYGEEFIGAGEFEVGQKVTLEALDRGAAAGTLRFSPIDNGTLAIYRAPPEVHPAVILHGDGYSDFYFGEVTPESLRERIEVCDRFDAFGYDWCVGTTAVNYPSQVATPFGGQREVKFWRDGDRVAAERLEKLLADGGDPLKILSEYARERKVRLSFTQRAGAYYRNATNSSMNAQFFIDHPEFYMCGADGKVLNYEKPSYAFPEVREFYLEMIREIAARHPDAVTIEFLRHPPFFGCDRPLIDEYIRRHGAFSPANFRDDKWQEIQCDIMLEHLKNVRAAIDAVDPAIQLEINFDWKDYRLHGLDLDRILEQGLVDLISPGIYAVGSEKYFPLRPFVEMAAKSPRPVRVFPRVEATIFGGDPTPEEEKGLVKIERRSLSVPMFKALYLRFLADGADGIRPFNTGGGELAAELADRAELKRFERFEMPLLDLREEI